MASYSLANVPPHTFPRTSSLSSHFCPSILSFRICRHVASLVHTRVCALNTGSDADGLVKKPVGSTGEGISGILGGDKGGSVKMTFEEDSENERWVDWEDQILEDTVPLVSFVRMLLHSGKYESGERLIPEHESTILEKLLPFHPEFEKKKGCGIDHITIGYHPNFERSRCLFIVRTDGELVDFSYWKCIKGLIRKNYPLYADSFILRHFRRRRRNY